MSTRIRRFAHDFRPSTLAALIEVALIGSWDGPCFLDDDAEFADVEGFVAAEPASPTSTVSTLEATGDGSHPVAA
jgi:hypothetical protein